MGDAANLVVVADQATYDATLADAQDASQQCLCNAKEAHALAWASAQKVVADNTQAWKEAHHVKCAVDGTPDDGCSVPTFNVNDKPVIAEAAGATCQCTYELHSAGGYPIGADSKQIRRVPFPWNTRTDKYASDFAVSSDADCETRCAADPGTLAYVSQTNDHCWCYTKSTVDFNDPIWKGSFGQVSGEAVWSDWAGIINPGDTTTTIDHWIADDGQTKVSKV